MQARICELPALRCESHGRNGHNGPSRPIRSGGWLNSRHIRLEQLEVFPLLPFADFELIARKLAHTPYSRRAQAITWKVWEDNVCYDPACLQSIWCRILPDDAGQWRLNTNVRFRSNDAYKAALMNMFALIQLQTRIADRIAELSGRTVVVGRYVHQADSYHIYGSYFREFEERFLKALHSRTFEQRTYRYADVKAIMDDAVPAILDKASKMGRL